MTRAAHQAEELAAPLRALGFEVVLLPVIGIAPPSDPEPLRCAAVNADDYDWIVFSSANAVEAFSAHRFSPPLRAQIATVGSATREAAERHGFVVNVTPEKYVAEALVEVISQSHMSQSKMGLRQMNGSRVLIPCAAVTRDVIPRELRKLGADVDVVEAYRNVLPPEAVDQAPLLFRPPCPDWITFTSSSAVDNVVQLVGVDNLRRVKIASIGPITSATIRHHGLEPHIEAKEHSVKGLIDAYVMMQTSQ